jgi:hypothetical protein
MSGLASSSIPWVNRTKPCRSRCPQKAFSSRRELDISGSLFVIQDPTELCESMVVYSMITCDTPLGCSVFYVGVHIIRNGKNDKVDYISSSEGSDLKSL